MSKCVVPAPGAAPIGRGDPSAGAARPGDATQFHPDVWNDPTPPWPAHGAAGRRAGKCGSLVNLRGALLVLYRQSSAMPLALIVFPHFAISLSRKFWKYSDDRSSGETRSAPILCVCVCTTGSSIAATVAS
jgi:hypothetical protein